MEIVVETIQGSWGGEPKWGKLIAFHLVETIQGSWGRGGKSGKLISIHLSRSVPCVGVSIGIERLFSIMEANLTKESTKIRTVHTQVTRYIPRRPVTREGEGG